MDDTPIERPAPGAIRFDVLTLFPDLFQGYLTQSLLKLAIHAGLVQIHLWNIRDWAAGKHKSVDDRPFGGGPGMVRSGHHERSVSSRDALCLCEPASWKAVGIDRTRCYAVGTRMRLAGAKSGRRFLLIAPACARLGLGCLTPGPLLFQLRNI